MVGPLCLIWSIKLFVLIYISWQSVHNLLIRPFFPCYSIVPPPLTPFVDREDTDPSFPLSTFNNFEYLNLLPETPGLWVCRHLPCDETYVTSRTRVFSPGNPYPRSGDSPTTNRQRPQSLPLLHTIPAKILTTFLTFDISLQRWSQLMTTVPSTILILILILIFSCPCPLFLFLILRCPSFFRGKEGGRRIRCGR